MATPATSVRHRAEELAARFPPLLVAAERVAMSVSQGVHGRRRVGIGETFWQFRRYQPGDAVTQVDWRQTAKGDAVFVRETEWEAAQTVWLWRAGSPSMDYRSDQVLDSKRSRADLLLLALAFLLSRAGERAALLGVSRAPMGGRAMPARLAALVGSGEAAAGELPVRTRLPRHARAVLFGDFLAPPEEAASLFAHYAGQGVKGQVVRIIDPAEAEFPFAGRVRFQDADARAQTLIGRAETVREEYLTRAESHDRALAAAARAWGWNYLVHRTDRPPQMALLALHQALGGR